MLKQPLAHDIFWGPRSPFLHNGHTTFKTTHLLGRTQRPLQNFRSAASTTTPWLHTTYASTVTRTHRPLLHTTRQGSRYPSANFANFAKFPLPASDQAG